MRLRPDGNKGMIARSLASFADYQAESAWTWEHQALVRARPSPVMRLGRALWSACAPRSCSDGAPGSVARRGPFDACKDAHGQSG